MQTYATRCFNGLTFSFNGKASDMYGLFMGWRSANEEWETGLTREIVKTETNMVRHIPNQYGVKYTDVLVLDFEIYHQNGTPFDYRESRDINNWLIHDTYKVFKVHDNNVDNVYYKAICTAIQDITIGGFFAKHITMTCDSPFGYMRETKKTADARTSGEEILKINNTSDDGDYYPYITLTCDGEYSGTVELYNETEDKSMTLDFANIETNADSNNKELRIDCQKMMILDADNVPVPLYKLGWHIETDETRALQTTELYWFRLVPGINHVRVTGNTKAVFTMSFPRKAGQVDEERNLSM